jgi:hypothetical protein
LKGKLSQAKPEVAIAVSGGPGTGQPYRGVALCRLGDRVEVIERRKAAGETNGLAELTAALAAKARSAGGIDAGTPVAGALVVSGSSLATFRLDVPDVKNRQLESIIRMQVESKLPIAADQIRLAWRSDGSADKGRACTVIAGRASRYDAPMLAARKAGLTAAVPDWEAAARAWGLDATMTGRKVVLHLRATSTAAMLIEEGRLVDAVNLDAGMEDFGRGAAAGEKLQLFIHDLWNTLARFGSAQLPEVLVAAREHREAIAALLKESGIESKAAWPTLPTSSGADPDDDPRDYIEAIGGASLAMGPAEERLDLMAAHPDLQPARKPLVTMATGVALAAALLAAVIFLAAARKLDEAAYAKLQDDRIAKLVGVQDLRKKVAEQRPDLLDLLTKVNESLQSGMLLESFTFQKGKPVTLSSFASSLEQAAKFEEELKKKPGISEVKILDRTFDDRRNRWNFKVTMGYLPFTKSK